jgi:dephospho-CoA kinase
MNHLFAFCGPIGSGKSSVSKLFATKHGATWSGFGATVREIALERGLATDRGSLQCLGATLVKNEAGTFCRRVIALTARASDKPAVIDGLRHIAILQELRHILNPRKVVCIYVDAPLTIRLERVKKRDGLSPDQLARLEMHSTEVEVEHRLKGIADFVVDNQKSVAECVDSIMDWMQRSGLSFDFRQTGQVSGNQ